MASSKITLIGFYKFMDFQGQDLFSKLTIPEELDRETLINNILLNGGEFEVIYSDPEFLQNAIGSWSKKWEWTFDKWIKAINISYNPLENYDRMEEWSDNSTAIGRDSSSGTGSSNTIDKISSYDSSIFENDTNTNTETANSNTSSSTLTNSNIKTGRAHGNIGVTTSQQMLQSELDIAKWNIYEHITDVFLSEFVIPLY